MMDHRLPRLYRAPPAEREWVAGALGTALGREPDLDFAWLHGSFLSGGAFHDIDVGVGLPAPADVRFRRGPALGVRLDREVGYPVDVRVLDDAPVTFLFHVFRQGRLLFVRDEERLADLMERTVREYLDMEPLLRRATVEAYGA